MNNHKCEYCGGFKAEKYTAITSNETMFICNNCMDGE